MSNLPNRKERRKMAKKMGLFGKEKTSGSKSEKSTRSQSMGKLIRLRNLTEQRNVERKYNQEED